MVIKVGEKKSKFYRSMVKISVNNFVLEKDRNSHLNDAFPLKIVKISLQKISKIPYLFQCMMVINGGYIWE